MTRVGRVIAITATVWLSCQIASVVIMPVAAWVGAIGLTECICPHGAGAACPMHKQPESGSKMCVMRSVDDQSTMVFGSMFGLTPPPPKAVVIAYPALVWNVTLRQFSLILLRPSPPEPPPPRA